MKYRESTRLSNLHNIDYKEIQKRVEESPYNLKINLDMIVPYLKLIQEEAKIVHKEDIDVSFSFLLAGSGIFTYVQLNVETNNNILLSHINPSRKKLTIYEPLDNFNKFKTPTDMLATLFDRPTEQVSSTDYTKNILNVLGKIDELLVCDKNLLNSVINNKIYPKELEVSHDSFEIKISNISLKISSKLKNTKGKSLFSINVGNLSACKVTTRNMRIGFNINEQQLLFTHNQFVELDVNSMRTALVSLLNLYEISISKIEDLQVGG